MLEALISNKFILLSFFFSYLLGYIPFGYILFKHLRNKDITGKDAEKALVMADITANKNMVPFDDKSPFITSGIRFGTPAITTRGLKEGDMSKIVDFIDIVIKNHENDNIIKRVKNDVNQFMKDRDLFIP